MREGCRGGTERGDGKRGRPPALTAHLLLQALAEAPQLLLADPAGGPQEAGDERGRRGDLGPHVRPGPAASAARPGPRGRGRLRATAARRGRDGAGLLCRPRGGGTGAAARTARHTDSPTHGQRSGAPAGRTDSRTHGQPAPPGSARGHRPDAAPPLRPARRSFSPTELTGATRGRAPGPARRCPHRQPGPAAAPLILPQLHRPRYSGQTAPSPCLVPFPSLFSGRNTSTD